MARAAGAYSAIGGATLKSDSFVTSAATALSIRGFKLKVTDATGAVVAYAVTVTANAVPFVSISPFGRGTTVSGATSALRIDTPSAADPVTVSVRVTDSASAS
jgi:hypothetical protein